MRWEHRDREVCLVFPRALRWPGARLSAEGLCVAGYPRRGAGWGVALPAWPSHMITRPIDAILDNTAEQPLDARTIRLSQMKGDFPRDHRRRGSVMAQARTRLQDRLELRDDVIVALLAEGFRPGDVAREFGLTTEEVREIREGGTR